MKNILTNIRLISLIIGFFSLAPAVRAATITSKNSNDIFKETLVLKKLTLILRKNKRLEGWPKEKIFHKKLPRHVFQKSLEVLNKFSKIRSLQESGHIIIPIYPSREITPNEVNDFVERLVLEMEIILNSYSFKIDGKIRNSKTYKNKTPSDIFSLLSQISTALDPILGIRGVNPNDVYQQSIYVKKLAYFIRKTQNLAQVKEPEIETKNQTPFQSLLKANELLKKISKIQHKLMILPVNIDSVPRKVAKPIDVFNALQISTAELQRVIYRLGFEQDIKLPRLGRNKNPKKVIQKIDWAIKLLPNFSNIDIIYQQDPLFLIKKPKDIYKIVLEIENELSQFIYKKGIRKQIYLQKFQGMQPKHAYSKGLESLSKINHLRVQYNFGNIAVPKYPLRKITQIEVYDLTNRLKQELRIIYKNSNIDLKESTQEQEQKSITFSKVYSHLVKISETIDLLFGSETYISNDDYIKTKKILEEIKLIASFSNRNTKIEKHIYTKEIHPKDILEISLRIKNKLKSIKKSAGFYETDHYHQIKSSENKYNKKDTYSQFNLIYTEIFSLKRRLGITKRIQKVSKVSLKNNPIDIYNNLQYSLKILEKSFSPKEKQ